MIAKPLFSHRYPSVVDHGADAWEKSAPHREQMMLYAAEFQVWVYLSAVSLSISFHWLDG